MSEHRGQTSRRSDPSRFSLRVLVFASALLVLALVGASPTGARAVPADSEGIRITETLRSKFPRQAYVLSLPSRAKLSPENVTVLENGQPVHDLQLSLPGTGGSATFGVVLLIDASNSMRGEPIEQATIAARNFSKRLPEGVQIAVVLFNNAVDVLTPFTTDRAVLSEALATPPPLEYGTHIYDAVDEAENLLAESDIAVGSIVLLSDGRDVGSKVKPAPIIQRAREGKARIFSVGLESREFTPTALRGLAAASQGTFALASKPKELNKIYSEIGSRISRQYLLTYESFAAPAERVVVAVRAEGFSDLATATYNAPALTAADLEVPRSWYNRAVQSTITAGVVAALVALLVGIGTYLVARRRNRSLELRMAHFVTMPIEERARVRQYDVATELELRERRERHLISLQDMRWYKRLEDDVELGRLPTPAYTIVVLTALASVFAAVVAIVWIGPLGVLALVLPPYIAYQLVTRKLRRLRSQFADQLPETLDVVASALRAGHSLVGALTVAVEGAPEPSRTEFGRAMADEQLGVPLDTSLRLVAHRMANRDVMQVSLVAQLQREAGTNAAEVLDQVAANVRNQMELRRLIKTLTAQGRLSRWIVSILPIILFVAIFVLNRDYLKPLWDTAGGQVAMVLAILMIISGSYLIKRIVEIDA